MEWGGSQSLLPQGFTSSPLLLDLPRRYCRATCSHFWGRDTLGYLTDPCGRMGLGQPFPTPEKDCPFLCLVGVEPSVAKPWESPRIWHWFSIAAFQGLPPDSPPLCATPHPWQACLLNKPPSPACGLMPKNEEVVDFSALCILPYRYLRIVCCPATWAGNS